MERRGAISLAKTKEDTEKNIARFLDSFKKRNAIVKGVKAVAQPEDKPQSLSTT